MKITQDKFDYMYIGMDYLKKIPNNITRCKNNIYYFYGGIYYFLNDKIMKFKHIPKVIVENIDTDEYFYVLIFNNHIIPLHWGCDDAIEYIKKYKDLFIKSYNSNHIYGTQLMSILDDLRNHKPIDINIDSHKKDYLHIRSCTDIYYDEFNINNDIIIESSSVKLLTKNGRFIKIKFNKDITKAYFVSPFNNLRYKKDIDFINKHIDIFRICKEYYIPDNIKDMIRDIDNGMSLKDSLKKYV